MGNEHDFVTGPSFDPVTTYSFPNDRKALEYVLYLLSRLACCYLRSVAGSPPSTGVTEVWGKIIIGILYNINWKHQRFSVLRFESFLGMVVFLCDGIDIATIVVDGLLPCVLRSCITVADLALAEYTKKALKLVISERRRGKTIRLLIDGSDESFEATHLAKEHVVVVFGDSNSRGHFRGSYVLEFECAARPLINTGTHKV